MMPKFDSMVMEYVDKELPREDDKDGTVQQWSQGRWLQTRLIKLQLQWELEKLDLLDQRQPRRCCSRNHSLLLRASADATAWTESMNQMADATKKLAVLIKTEGSKFGI
jgi:hypothetical protein